MKKPRHPRFVTNLQLERDAIKAFIKILEEEQNALVQGKIENLDYLASQKTKIIEKLTSLGNERDQYLAVQGLSLNTERANNVFPAKDTAISVVWTELLQLAKTAKQLNQTNGTIISTRLQHSQQALNTLKNAAGNVSLYGSKGQAIAIGS